MELDKESQEFAFTTSDRWAMGHPHIPLDQRVSTSKAEEVLGRAMDQLTLNAQIDPSVFPAGAQKNKLVSESHRRSELLRGIISGVVEFTETSVAIAAENWLRENS